MCPRPHTPHAVCSAYSSSWPQLVTKFMYDHRAARPYERKIWCVMTGITWMLWRDHLWRFSLWSGTKFLLTRSRIDDGWSAECSRAWLQVRLLCVQRVDPQGNSQPERPLVGRSTCYAHTRWRSGYFHEGTKRGGRGGGRGKGKEGKGKETERGN